MLAMYLKYFNTGACVVKNMLAMYLKYFKLESSLRKFYDRCLVTYLTVAEYMSQMTNGHVSFVVVTVVFVSPCS